MGTLGPRLKSGGDGPIAVVVQGSTASGAADLAIFNGGSGTVTELPGVGRGFFDDRAPRTLVNLGSALVQPPTFAGDSGLGYDVTASGELVRFDLSNPSGGSEVVFSGQQVVAAQAVAGGQVVAAFAGGGVDLLEPRGNTLAVESILQAQGGVPAAPSTIDVVTKPGGQLNVLVSSEGSDNIFVFAQVGSQEVGGGVLPGGASPPTLNTVANPTLSSATASATFTLLTSAITTSASATTSSASTSASASSASVSSTSTASIGLSLGGFSSLGNRSTLGNADTVLVPVEGNTYLSVPVLDFGFGTEGDDGNGQHRMPALSGKYNFGDTSAVTRFVIGLDEALRGYRGANDLTPSIGAGSLEQLWNEDLFHHHLSVPPPAAEHADDDPQAAQPAPQPLLPGARSGFEDAGAEKPADPQERRLRPGIGAGFMALTGLIAGILRTGGISRSVMSRAGGGRHGLEVENRRVRCRS